MACLHSIDAPQNKKWKIFFAGKNGGGLTRLPPILWNLDAASIRVNLLEYFRTSKKVIA